MIDVQELKQKAISYLENNGPTIPVRIGKELGIDPIWASAILSELIQTHQIKISSMKVGSTPVYYLEGQEQQLEKFADEHLKDTPKKAYLLLKEKKILDDAIQDPQTRVALRSLKDFAVMFNKEGRIMWKYAFAKEEVEETEEEVEKVKEDKTDLDSQTPEKNSDSQISEPSSPKKVEKTSEFLGGESETNDEKKVEPIFEEDGQEEKEDLLTRVKQKLEKLNIKILEETDVKKRELKLLGRMQGNLGETEILIIAKDKKSLTEKDFEKIFEIIKQEKKLTLLFTTGEIAKKSIESYREYKNLIRVRPL